MNVIVTLGASVVALAVLTVINLLLCLAVVRRLRAVEESIRASGPPDTPAPGTVISGFTATTTSGAVLSSEDLGRNESFVGVLSVGCPACEEFAAELNRGIRSLPEHAVLFVAAGADVDPGPMVRQLGTRAAVVVTAEDGPELSAFGRITAFPTFMRIERGVVAASHVRADAILGTFPAPLTGAGR